MYAKNKSLLLHDNAKKSKNEEISAYVATELEKSRFT